MLRYLLVTLLCPLITIPGESSAALSPLRMPEALRDALQAEWNDDGKWRGSRVRRSPWIQEIWRQSNVPDISFVSPDVQRNQMTPTGLITPGVYSCGHQGSELMLNFVNPSFPGQDSSAGVCLFRIVVDRPEVCQVRVDFVDTELLTPKNGNCEDQWFVVGGDIWPTGFYKLCGVNSDQHFYIHLDKTDQVQEVDFTINTARNGKAYKFGFWITQIDCSTQSRLEAPAGCTQYYLGASGVVKSFNFEGVQYLSNQNYRVCIRSQRDSCYMMYEADSNHFRLQLFISDGNRRFVGRRSQRRGGRRSTPSGRGEEDCGLDYVLIPGGRGNATDTGPTYDRFCGGVLNIESNEDFGIPIYSQITTQVTWLQVVTTNRNAATIEAINRSRQRVANNLAILPLLISRRRNEEVETDTGVGFRLRYSQLNDCDGRSEF